MNELIQNLLQLQTLEFSETPDDNSATMIAALRTKIPAQMARHYDRFRERGKKGLVVVNDQVCAGCHMRLPLGVIMTLKRGQDIQLCGSCGRYLYLPDQALPTTTLDATVVKVPHGRHKSDPGRLRA